jgi:hypothetical protein
MGQNERVHQTGEAGDNKIMHGKHTSEIGNHTKGSVIRKAAQEGHSCSIRSITRDWIWTISFSLSLTASKRAAYTSMKQHKQGSKGAYEGVTDV